MLNKSNGVNNHQEIELVGLQKSNTMLSQMKNGYKKSTMSNKKRR